MSRRVVVVADRYPCVSESFVRNDLAALEKRGISVSIVACCPPERCDRWISSPLEAEVLHTSETLKAFPLLKKAAVCFNAMSCVGFGAAFFRGRIRPLRGTARTAWTASVVGPRIARWRPDWVHAEFLGLPAAVGRLLAARLSVPFSISAHARDIFVPAMRLDRLCSTARFVAVCSSHARASLIGRLPPQLAEKVLYCPHVVACPPLRGRRPEGPARPPLFLCVARLVPKKGIDTVLQALALVRRRMHFRFRVVGGGPESDRLQQLARQLSLDCVEFTGPEAPSDVAAHLAQADLFVLGTRTAADGDRDGIPNALLEAMAAGVPVVATDGGAVSEIIRHRWTGWLSPPDDRMALADCICEAASMPELRNEITERAWFQVRRRFSSDNPNSLADQIERGIASRIRGGCVDFPMRLRAET